MTSQVRTVVREWCKEQNAISGANRYLLGAFIVGAIGLVIATSLSSFGIFITFGIGAIWYNFAPKPWNLNNLSSDTLVPDSLLKTLSDSNQVTQDVKGMLSEKLRKQKYLNFGNIWDVEAHIRTRAHEAARTTGEGHKALLAHSKSDVNA